jgi:hypothetical protein
MARGMRTGLSTGVIAGGVALLVAAAGCRPGATLASPGGVATAGMLGEGASFAARDSGLVVGPLRAEGSLNAGAFWPSADRVDTFRRRLSGARGEEEVERSIEATGAGAIEVRLATGGERVGRNRLVLDEAGDVVIAENEGNGIASVFTPAALFLPARLGAGERVERAFDVRSEGGLFGTGSGAGTGAVEGVGLQTVRTAEGDVEAFAVDSRLDFRVGPARIVLSSRGWFATAPGGPGLVAEEGRELVKVFGLTVHDVTRVSVLERAGAATAD